MRQTVSALLLATVLSYGATAAAKKRIAILDFGNPAVQASANPYMARSVGAAQSDVGKSVADLLINAMVRDGNCIVIERNELDKVLLEQNFSNSDRADAATAARLGRILGVDAIIVGSVTRYDHSDLTTSHGRSYGLYVSHGSKHDIKADVQITARIVNPDSAEIMAVAQGASESERKGVKEAATDQYFGNTAADLTADATNKAVVSLAQQLEQNLATMPARKHTLDALVADVNPTRIIINAGTLRGVKPGDHLEIWRAGKAIRDPETGKVLRYDDEPLGEAVVTESEDSSASATYTSSGAVKIGDHVRAKD